MKKLSLIFKETSEKLLKDNLKGSQGIFVIDYTKLSSPDLSALRQSLKSAKSQLFVVKNSIARRALKAASLDSLLERITGPCGIVFAKEEPVSISKILYGFSKEHENLRLQGGFLKDKILEKKDIEALALLPAKEVLRAQLVMALKSPITGLVMVLHHTLGKIVYCLEEIKKKKDVKVT
ncbi:MAG: 50S ribosomal protein L10 [Candidatus Omnitrophica bacterium]|nr:50S ribosomal protein L10 [Candidatus Omnitrophota bacterium]